MMASLSLVRTMGVRSVIASCLILWVFMVLAGFMWLTRHATTAAKRGETPKSWPAGTGLMRDSNRANLVMFVHPRCPCTRASIAELNEIVESNPGRVAVQILCFSPAGYDESLSATDIWQLACAIPGARVARDEDGLEARCFGVLASGHIVLFDRDGKVAFSGGITRSRGHRGDSAGRQAVLHLLGNRPASDNASVFGCPLSSPSSPCQFQESRQ